MAGEARVLSRALRFTGGILGVLVVVAVWGALHLRGLERTPFHTKGEPREAVVVQEILRGGGWILPRRNGVELPRKPPLFHWLGAIASHAFGTADEGTIRIPSAVLSGGSTLLVFFAGALLFGTRPALIAALALLTSFEWLRAATSARVDMTLAFGTTLAFTSLMLFRVREHPAWLVMLYVGGAWATLSKGPVGIALPALQIIALCAIDRSFAFARRLRLSRGVPAVLLLAGAWYGLAAIEGGQAFVHTQLIDENVFRFIGHKGATGGHRHSVAYLGLMLLAGLLPWTFFIPSVAASVWQARHTLSRRDPRLFAVVWCVVVFGFHSFPVSKRGVYLLPLYPAVCLLLGWWVDGLMRGDLRTRWLPRLAPPVAWTLAAILAGTAIAAASHAVGFPLLDAAKAFLGTRAATELSWITATIPLHYPEIIALFSIAAAGAIVAALAAARRRWATLITGVILSIGAVVLAVRQIILPEFARYPTRRAYVAEIRSIVREPEALYAYRDFDYGVVFYWNGRIPVFGGPLSGGAPRYLLMKEGQWSQLRDVDRCHYERIPGLESGRSGNLGRLVLLQRSDRCPATPMPEHHQPKT